MLIALNAIPHVNRGTRGERKPLRHGEAFPVRDAGLISRSSDAEVYGTGDRKPEVQVEALHASTKHTTFTFQRVQRFQSLH